MQESCVLTVSSSKILHHLRMLFKAFALAGRVQKFVIVHGLKGRGHKPERKIRLRPTMIASRNHGSVGMIANFWTRPALAEVGEEGAATLSLFHRILSYG
jgi:hypothetical protein